LSEARSARVNPRAATEATAGQIRDGFARRAKHDTHESGGIPDLSTASTGS